MKNSSSEESFSPSSSSTLPCLEPSLPLMHKREILIEYAAYENGEFPDEDKDLLDKATQAALKAYAPYSKFHVGAAIQLKDIDGSRHIVKSSNQENISYPEGLCAERVGLFYVGAEYPEATIEKILIVAMKDGKLLEESIKPCGGCRQVIVEAARRQNNKPIEVILYGTATTLVMNHRALLPFVFDDF